MDAGTLLAVMAVSLGTVLILNLLKPEEKEELRVLQRKLNYLAVYSGILSKLFGENRMAPFSLQRTEMTVRTAIALIDALNRGAIEQAAELIAPNCILTTPEPPPAGQRRLGREAVLHYLIALRTRFQFIAEETMSCGYRCAVRLRFSRQEIEAKHEPLTGIMLLGIRNGAAIDIDFYVKGSLD